MKTLLALTLSSIFAGSLLSAQTVLFDPTFATGTSTSAPVGVTAGSPYTQTVSGGGTVSYSPAGMTVGDFSDSSSQAYISSTVANPNATGFTTQLTFTPNFSAIDPTGGARTYAMDNLLSIYTANSNNALLTIGFQAIGYGDNQDTIFINSGIQFGGNGSVGTGNTSYSSKPIDSLSGTTFSLTLYTTFSSSASPTGTSSVTTNGILSDAANPDLANFNYTVTSNYNGTTGFDPFNNPLLFELGIVPGSGAGDGIINPGATFTISNASVTTGVPEPSTYALMLGGLGLLAFVARRRLA